MAIFKIAVGHFGRGSEPEGYQAALPTAQKEVADLHISSAPQETPEVDLKEARDQFWVGSSNPNPVSFNLAGGPIDQDQAVSLLATALGYKATYWFDEFATDQYVSSDSATIHWQEVKFYVDENDRSQFNGLWQYELRRITDSDFHILMKRLPRK